MESMVEMRREFPKIIHFIWLGGLIPEKYYDSIRSLAIVAERSGFEINLWTDNPKKQQGLVERWVSSDMDVAWPKTFVEKLGILNLRVREISELISRMERDEFYQDRSFLNAFIANVNRELIGFSNYAAASDLLRLEILRQEGGYYLDTDTEFEINDDYMLSPDIRVLGFMTNISFSCSVHNGNAVQVEYRGINNDIIAALPNHVIIQNTIRSIIANYAKLEKTSHLVQKDRKTILTLMPNDVASYLDSDRNHLRLYSIDKRLVYFIEGEEQSFESNPENNLAVEVILRAFGRVKNSPIDLKDDSYFTPFGILLGCTYEDGEDLACARLLKAANRLGHIDLGQSDMDLKRYSLSMGSAHEALNNSPRAYFTIRTSGPNVLASEVVAFWKQQDNITLRALDSLQLCEDGGRHDLVKRIAGLAVTPKSDLTWLQKKSKSRAFNDTDLDSARFFVRKRAFVSGLESTAEDLQSSASADGGFSILK